MGSRESGTPAYPDLDFARRHVELLRELFPQVHVGLGIPTKVILENLELGWRGSASVLYPARNESGARGVSARRIQSGRGPSEAGKRSSPAPEGVVESLRKVAVRVVGLGVHRDDAAILTPSAAGSKRCLITREEAHARVREVRRRTGRHRRVLFDPSTSVGEVERGDVEEVLVRVWGERLRDVRVALRGAAREDGRGG